MEGWLLKRSDGKVNAGKTLGNTVGIPLCCSELTFSQRNIIHQFGLLQMCTVKVDLVLEPQLVARCDKAAEADLSECVGRCNQTLDRVLREAVAQARDDGMTQSEIIEALHEVTKDVALPVGLVAAGIADCGRTKLQRAAKNGDAEMLNALLRLGAEVDGNPNRVGTPLCLAASHGHAKIAEALLQARANPDGSPCHRPLHSAARNGSTAVVDVLLRAGARPDEQDEQGRTAADLAMHNDKPLIIPLVDPSRAKVEGDKLRLTFRNAPVVHVLSTRFNWKGEYKQCCDPSEAARCIKNFLETGKAVNTSDWRVIVEPVRGTKVFNPNADNALLMSGDPEAANAIWLRNWREIGLERAKETGGYCIQIMVQGGLSDMQIAEQSMANDKGVPVIQLFCDDIIGLPHPGELEPKLRSLADQIREPPPTYGEAPIELREPKGEVRAPAAIHEAHKALLPQAT